MAHYKLTEKGKAEAKKKRTAVKMFGEAVTFGGMWKGEDYANMLLVTMAAKPDKAQDVEEINRATFNKPRPSKVKIARTMGHLTRKGFVKIIPTSRMSRTGFSDRGGTRLSRSPRRGFRKLRR